MILDIAAGEEIPAKEKNLSMTELYTADEVFTTGTMGELTPVLLADGRTIGDGKAGKLTERLQKLHRQYAWDHGEALPFV
jgi:branched-chain amino acid aminotransferase